MTADQNPAPASAKPLFASDYVSLSTLKKNGQWVDTPVWFAGDQYTVYIFSAGQAGKVKRLRNFTQVKLTPCTALGKKIGETIEGQATLLSEQSSIDNAHQALLQRFGWQMRLTDWLSKLSGKFSKRQYIKVLIG